MIWITFDVAEYVKTDRQPLYEFNDWKEGAKQMKGGIGLKELYYRD